MRRDVIYMSTLVTRKIKMKSIFTCLALCLSLLSAVAQEAPAIEGLYSVKLGAKPGERVIDLGGGMAPIFNIRVVALPEMKKEGNTAYCKAILNSDGVVVAIQGVQKDLESYDKILADLTKKYGKPREFRFKTRISTCRDTTESVVFEHGGRALSLTRTSSDKHVFLRGCYDVEAVKKVLNDAGQPENICDRLMRKAFSASIGYEEGITKWDPPPYEIGSEDVAWKISHEGRDAVVVTDGWYWWVLLDGTWAEAKSSGKNTFEIGDVRYVVKGDGDGREFLRIEKADKDEVEVPVKAERVSQGIANMPPKQPMVGVWVEDKNGKKVLTINKDGTIVWKRPRESDSDAVENWRWKYRFQRLVAIPDDFEPETNKYYCDRVVLSVSDDGNRIWDNDCDETYSRKSGVEHTAKAIAERLDKDVGNE